MWLLIISWTSPCSFSWQDFGSDLPFASFYSWESAYDFELKVLNCTHLFKKLACVYPLFFVMYFLMVSSENLNLYTAFCVIGRYYPISLNFAFLCSLTQIIAFDLNARTSRKEDARCAWTQEGLKKRYTRVCANTRRPDKRVWDVCELREAWERVQVACKCYREAGEKCVWGKGKGGYGVCERRKVEKGDLSNRLTTFSAFWFPQATFWPACGNLAGRF